jgi:hypothetical protein
MHAASKKFLISTIEAATVYLQKAADPTLTVTSG